MTTEMGTERVTATTSSEVTVSGILPHQTEPPHRSLPPAASAKLRRWTLLIGVLAVASMATTVWLGLWVTPPDRVQGNLVRLVYIHPGVAWVALYLAFGLAALSSLLYLWPRTRSLFWDRLAAAAVEVGVVFLALTLISGSIWGRPTWGVYWAWDARLTSTAILLVLFLGYMALRRVPAEADVRAKRCAFAALFSALDIPIVHFSVLWWKTLHQGATVLNPNLSPKIHGSMAWTLLLSFVALTLVFVWMTLVRYRIGAMEDWLGSNELDMALRERRSEGDAPCRSEAS
ncbi:MAG: cytochrome c biogenesis protein CcsA [Acidimicrobiales bacterium]